MQINASAMQAFSKEVYKKAISIARTSVALQEVPGIASNIENKTPNVAKEPSFPEKLFTSSASEGDYARDFVSLMLVENFHAANAKAIQASDEILQTTISIVDTKA